MTIPGNPAFTFIPADGGTPAGTDCAVIMDTDEMAPYINAGDTMYISRRQEPMIGEVGLFFYNEKLMCRQLCADSTGRIYLFCANRRRRSRDVCIPPEEKDKVFLFGKVITDRVLPLPDHM